MAEHVITQLCDVAPSSSEKDTFLYIHTVMHTHEVEYSDFAMNELHAESSIYKQILLNKVSSLASMALNWKSRAHLCLD